MGRTPDSARLELRYLSKLSESSPLVFPLCDAYQPSPIKIRVIPAWHDLYPRLFRWSNVDVCRYAANPGNFGPLTSLVLYAVDDFRIRFEIATYFCISHLLYNKESSLDNAKCHLLFTTLYLKHPFNTCNQKHKKTNKQAQKDMRFTLLVKAANIYRLKRNLNTN